MRKSLPSISVCVPTYNSGALLDRCLRLVRNQNYPQSKIEIILGDGGSGDDTLEIGRKYGAKIVSVPSEKQNAEYNRGVAYNLAKGELVLILDHDNFLVSKNWLRKMVDPLIEHSDMVATTTCFYHYSKKYKIMDRYFALMGTSEPLPFYLKKADRMPYGTEHWSLVGCSLDRGNYYLVFFQDVPNKFPSVGTNGTLVRRSLVNTYAKILPEYHYPVDVMFDVVRNGGPNKFGFVKTSVVHLTHAKGFIEFIKRRKRFVEQYYFRDSSKRRWSVFMKGDELELFKFIIFSLTFVKPTIDALVGYKRIRDSAWFVHPFMCFGTSFVYGYTMLRFRFGGPNK